MRFDKSKAEKFSERILGMEFKVGGRGEDNKIDCYGVIKGFYKEFGVELPDYSYIEDWNEKEEWYLKEYASFFRRLGSIEKLEIGDMILFKGSEEMGTHAGIYLGEGRFVHARSQVGTKIDELADKVWKSRIYGYFRLLEERCP